MGKPIKNPMMPLGAMSQKFLEQTLNQLQINTMTQRVYPKEVYSGYMVINSKRKEAGMWYSTGQGSESFAGRVFSGDNVGKITFAFTYNDYMRFVDMGVGLGTKYEDVETAKKARCKTRYLHNWARKDGKSHRPAIMMEFRHLQTRLGNYLRDYYGYEGEIAFVNTFAELSPLQIF